MALLFYGFMQRALIAAILMALLCPLLGVFLVLRRQSLLADTLSHVSLAGVALGLVVGQNPTLTTLIIVVLATILIEYLSRVYRTYSEVGIAVLMSAGLAVALVLMNINGGSATMSVEQYLFGSIVTISDGQVQLLAVLAVAIIGLFLLVRRPLYVMTFDPDTALAEGVNTKWLSLGFNVATGVTISVMMPIAGALLVSAIMILPAAIALRLAKSFSVVIVCGMIVSLIGIVGGLVASYSFNTPPGASITLIFIVIFIAVLAGRALVRAK